MSLGPDDRPGGARPAARRRDDHEVVHTITSAQEALSTEQDERARRYLISMALRTLCVILAIVVPSPWRWFFAVGAVVLPYIAVIAVNQRKRSSGPRG